LLALTLGFIESPAMAHFLFFLRQRRITFIFTRQTFDTESSAPLRTSSEIIKFLCNCWLGQLKWYACLPDIPQRSYGCAGSMGAWCAKLARRRYQRGSLILKARKWFGRWREEEIREGQLFRHRKYELLGTKAQFAMRRLALRELENRISSINDPG
jgi:hypothetical protein